MILPIISHPIPARIARSQEYEDRRVDAAGDQGTTGGFFNAGAAFRAQKTVTNDPWYTLKRANIQKNKWNYNSYN